MPRPNLNFIMGLCVIITKLLDSIKLKHSNTQILCWDLFALFQIFALSNSLISFFQKVFLCFNVFLLFLKIITTKKSFFFLWTRGFKKTGRLDRLCHSIVNRIGDFGLVLGIMGHFIIFQTIDFSTLFACVSEVPSFKNCLFQHCNFKPIKPTT